jgi:hypothetical protein
VQNPLGRALLSAPASISSIAISFVSTVLEGALNEQCSGDNPWISAAATLAPWSRRISTASTWPKVSEFVYHWSLLALRHSRTHDPSRKSRTMNRSLQFAYHKA